MNVYCSDSTPHTSDTDDNVNQTALSGVGRRSAPIYEPVRVKEEGSSVSDRGRLDDTYRDERRYDD